MLREELDRRHGIVQDAFELAHQLKVSAARSAAALHDGRTEKLDEEAKKSLDELVRKEPFLMGPAGGQIMLAYQEYAETKILLSIVKNGKMPDVDVPPESFVTGMGDAVGELKRRFLEELVAGDREEAKRILDAALEIHDKLKAYDYPDYLVRGLRRKKDQARQQVNSMLEALAKS